MAHAVACRRVVLRVISGRARGAVLKGPQGCEIRPTAGRVKEDIFNILSSLGYSCAKRRQLLSESVALEPLGKTWLELYCGTGQVGIEALSRGSSRVVFVDISPASAELVLKNLKKCRFPEESYAIHCADAVVALQGFSGKGVRFDTVFLDPPYCEDASPVLRLLVSLGVLREGAIVVLEQGSSPTDLVLPELLEVVRVKEYSAAQVLFFVYNPALAGV